MEGRRVSRRKPRRNPLYVLFMGLLALSLVLAMAKDQRRARRLGAALCAAALVLFVWYYPALSGLPTAAWHADLLNILPSFGFY